MTLVSPQIVAFDSSTLGIVAKDFWSTNPKARLKAQAFLSELRERGILVACAVNHVAELLRHENANVASTRLRFLNAIHHIAWIRPFAGHWFVGSILDLLLREVTAFRSDQRKAWRDIARHVRPQVWETGTGSEMFTNNPQLWSKFRRAAQQQHAEEKYVASVARSQAGGISQMSIGEIRNSPKRSPHEWRVHFPQFAAGLHLSLNQHGDSRLAQPAAVARQFAANTLERIESLDVSRGDFTEQLIDRSGIPKELIRSSTTIHELGELAVYAQQLKLFGELLNPCCRLKMTDIPIDTLPSYVLERRLRALQQRAQRVSGSDIGDGQLAVLVLYADCVQVDKRTGHYLKQLKRSDPKLGDLMCPIVVESDYSKIPEHVS